MAEMVAGCTGWCAGSCAGACIELCVAIGIPGMAMGGAGTSDSSQAAILSFPLIEAE